MSRGQSKRIRGRSRSGGSGGGGGGGGKGPNPLNRSYESNGPDVKIRGTAGTIADKYVQLSRDAQSAGDPVAAENYMQHAEHYYRLLAAAQAQYQPHQTFVRADADDFQDLDFDDEGGEEGEPNLAQASQPNAPQPAVGHQQGGHQQGGGQPRYNGQRPNGYNNQGGGQNPGGQNQNGQGGYASGRNGGDQRRNDRNDRRDNRYDRNDRPPQPRGDRREEDDQPTIGLPAFITGEAPSVAAETPPATQPEIAEQPVLVETVAVEAPVTTAATSEPSEPAEAAPLDAVAADAESEDGKTPSSRGRRRRYSRYGRRPTGEDAEGDSPSPAPDAPAD